MITKDQILTPGGNLENIGTLSQKTKVGIAVLKYERHSRIKCGFFMPIAQPSFMSGWAEQPRGWAVLVPLLQLRSVWHHDCSRDAGFATTHYETKS